MPKKQNEVMGEKIVEEISGETLRNKIYTIRGQRVMLDYDLAEIYGYTTKAFNQQVKNNLEKFEGEDFMFQLDWEETAHLSRSNFLTLNNGRGSNTKYQPYAFTEQGIYMLMTVLRGELAVKQSRTLIRLFKAMKDYIIENQERIDYRDNLRIAMAIADNAKDIKAVKKELGKVDKEMRKMNKKLGEAVMKSDLPVIFNKAVEQREFILLDGQLMRGSELYIDMYATAKQSVYIIDDYINVKTLRHLQKVKPGVEIIIFSDNKGHYLHKSDYLDFKKEYPKLEIKFTKTDGKIHDRFIILDYETSSEIIYHCGASMKDAGGKMTAISRLEDDFVVKVMKDVVERLKRNRELVLR